MRRILISLALVAGLVAALPAAAVPGGVVVSTDFSFTPGDDEIGTRTLHIARGTDVEYVNLHRNAPHSIAERGCLSFFGGSCRFRTPFVSFGGRATATTSSLAPGTYRFVCEVHPFTMEGTLVVL